MASLASLLALGLRLTIPAAAAPLEARADAPSVTIANGTYIGLHSPEYDQDFFLGIPYAQTPDRFTPSQSLNSTWDGTRDATAYPPHCPGFGSDNWGYEQSEDCLYLNIVKPSGVSSTEGVPVMLWIHGGGLFMGGSADRRYNLSFIVENSVEMGTPIIGVSINYRLSAYGFLCGQEALDAGLTNIGFRDQRLAIQWVHENIAAFGGDPDKVTIFGESSGAESVSAQVLAYNGRDDGLFRAAIAESGMGGAIYRYPGGFNATEAMQTTFDSLVLNTSCSSLSGTADTIPCLRQLPFEEINSTIASVIASVGAFPPVLDGDFIADYPTNQLNSGAFPKIPILIGTNTDEGSGFGGGSGPNTDAEFRARIERVLWSKLGNETINEIVDQIAAVYPDIQAVGIPALSSWPTVILPGSVEAKTFGLQYRRTNAFFGDMYFQYGRRRSNIAWSEAGVPSYAYNFNVTVNPLPAFISSTHFQEVAFVFLNLRGDGYSSNPFADKPESYQQLAKAISSAWVNFAVGLNPNGDSTTGLPEWPVYNTATGGGVGSNMKLQVENAHVELDSFRAEGIEWLRQNALSVFGN